MGDGAVLPDRDVSPRARVTRLLLSGSTVIRKEPLGAEAQRRLQHEVAVLERLRGVMGVAQVFDAPHYPGSIVLADAGQAILAQMVKPLALEGPSFRLSVGRDHDYLLAGIHY